MPSTEIAVAKPRGLSLAEKLTYAKELAASGLLPKAFRDQPANVLYAVEYGAMLDLPPMAAITGIHVIDGKPTASPALMSALVRTKGHKLRVRFDKTTMSAYAELTRADDPSFVFRADWDLERATAAQLCTVKNGKVHARDKWGNPTPWEKYTPNMLKWRCISEVCRDGAEECLMGMHYTPEELGAEVDAEGEVIQAVSERADQPADEAEQQAEVVDEAIELDWPKEIDAAESAGDLVKLGELWVKARGNKTQPPSDPELLERITAAAKRVKELNRQKQMNHLFALLAEGGISSSEEDKPRRLKAARGLLARETLATYADLTDAEIAEFIETLTGLKRVDTLAQRLIDFGGPPVSALKAVVEELLNAHNVEAAISLMEKVTSRADAEAEVADLLPESDKETLGIREGESVHLLQLAEKISRYAEDHRVGPRVVEPAAA